MNRYLFKRLFEVHILHEYYLTRSDGTSIFDATLAEQDTFLQVEFEKQNYNLKQDISIEPTENCKQLIKNFRLKFVQNHAGFIVGAEVRESLSEMGETLFEPIIPIDENLTLQFTITIKRPAFKDFTNQKLKERSKIYYFNNINEGDKTHPHISKKVAEYVDGKSYEMGELARHSGILKMANRITSTDNIADWEIITENPCVNENDRYTLKTKRFFYTPTANNINAITVLLKTPSGTTIKTITHSQTEPIGGIMLDFGTTSDGKIIPDNCYRLEVSENNAYNQISEVYLTDSREIINAFALIEIKTSPIDAFKLMEGKKLIVRKLGSVISQNHPIFRFLFRSRQTYWRYKSSKNENLQSNAGFLQNEVHSNQKPQTVITKKPQKLSATKTYLDLNVPLPSPANNDFLIEHNNTLQADIYCSEIFVSKI